MNTNEHEMLCSPNDFESKTPLEKQTHSSSQHNRKKSGGALTKKIVLGQQRLHETLLGIPHTSQSQPEQSVGRRNNHLCFQEQVQRPKALMAKTQKKR